MPTRLGSMAYLPLSSDNQNRLIVPNEGTRELKSETPRLPRDFSVLIQAHSVRNVEDQ